MSLKKSQRSFLNVLMTYTKNNFTKFQSFYIDLLLIFGILYAIIYIEKKNFCLVRVIIVFIIQHIIQGNSTPYVDCRPPALRKKGARSIRAFTHLLSAGFMHYMTARRIFILKCKTVSDFGDRFIIADNDDSVLTPYPLLS